MTGVILAIMCNEKFMNGTDSDGNSLVGYFQHPHLGILNRILQILEDRL